MNPEIDGSMGGLDVQVGDPMIGYFYDVASASNNAHLATVVVWRGASVSAPSELLKRMHHLRRRLERTVQGLLGRFRLPSAVRWSGFSFANGTRQAQFDASRRVVRVLGKEYSLPADGQVLVLLVDETATVGVPLVTVRDVPPFMQSQPGSVSPGNAHGRQQNWDNGSTRREAWAEHLRSDSEVQQFMDPRRNTEHANKRLQQSGELL